MTDKEWLEEIKDKYKADVYDCKLSRFDISWLIEQAERVQSLEFENHSVMQELNHVDAENKKHRELLESIRYTENVASEIFKTTDKKVISPDDLLQHILRKVNKFLEESE